MDVTILDLKSNNRHNGSPTEWFQRGLTDGANTFGVESIAELSTYPTMSPQFKKYWSIKNKTNFVLGAGQIHKHNFKITLNKKMTYADLQETQDNYFNITRALMLNIRGYPCHKSDDENAVTLAPSALDCITNYTIKYRTSYGSIGYVSLENNLPVFDANLLDGVNEFTSVFTNGQDNVS